jgi:hypothetical protein
VRDVTPDIRATCAVDHATGLSSRLPAAAPASAACRCPSLPLSAANHRS